MRLFATLFLLSIATSVTAGVYKWVQPDGSIIYSDRPPVENASPADLPPVQEIKVVPPPVSSAEPNTDQGTDQSQAGEYTTLVITEPANDSTLRDNAGQVSIKVTLDPPLQGEDSIAIIMDGKEIGQGKSTNLTLSNVDRGKHTLQATVINAKGSKLISSSPVSFQLFRASILQPNAQGQTPPTP